MRHGDVDAKNLIYLPLGFPEGLTTARNASNPNTQLDIGAGRAIVANSSDKRYVCVSTSTITKRLDAVWATGTGNGGRFSGAGAVAANQTWHLFIMRNDSNGAVDFGFDTSATAANKTAGWSCRMIWSIMTDSSGNIRDFVQTRNRCDWKTEILEVFAAIPTTATLYTITVPQGINVEANVRVASGVAANMSYAGILISSPLVADQDPGFQGAGPATVETRYDTMTPVNQSGGERVVTNLLGQIRARSSNGSYAVSPSIRTTGFIHPRGS